MATFLGRIDFNVDGGPYFYSDDESGWYAELPLKYQLLDINISIYYEKLLHIDETSYLENLLITDQPGRHILRHKRYYQGKINEIINQESFKELMKPPVDYFEIIKMGMLSDFAFDEKYTIRFNDENRASPSEMQEMALVLIYSNFIDAKDIHCEVAKNSLMISMRF